MEENKIKKWWKDTDDRVALCGSISLLCFFIGIIFYGFGIKIIPNIAIVLSLIAILPIIIEFYKALKE